jgi:ABC-type transporter Mla subunit MlaD
MKRFLKWTMITAAVTGGGTLLYRVLRTTRAQLNRGLENVAQVAEDARSALESTEHVLGRTEQAARQLRKSIS